LNYPVALDIGSVVCSLITMCFIQQWRHHMSAEGSTMAMLQWASKHGFDWSGTCSSVYVLWAMILVVTLCSLVQFATYILMHNTSDELSEQGEQVLSRLDFTLTILSLPVRLWWQAVMFGNCWMVNFASRFHRHDLLSFANSMAAALEVDDIRFNPVRQLKKLECMVTNRLRHASATWVRLVVVNIFAYLFGFIFLAASLVFGKNLPIRSIGLTAFVMMVTLGVMLALGAPLASVAETFEYDVLRALNNPLVLCHARRHIGDQMLPHLQFLEWGFRFSGAVITSRRISTIMLGLVTTLVGTVGQAIFDAASGAT